MHWQSQQTPLDDESPVNVTPLIDVSLVLVVILLLATPLAFESSIGVKSAQKGGKEATTKKQSLRVTLTLVDEQSVRVNQTLVARDELMAALEPALDETEERAITIACADNISHGAFVDVLDKAKRCGANGIAVSGR